MLKEYIEYIKNNPEGYWFKRKLYGWGWTPATWQGLLTVVAYIALVFACTLLIDKNYPTQENVLTFLGLVVLLTIAMVRICYVKGEKPKWQWGASKK